MLTNIFLLALFGIFSVYSCPTGYVDPGSDSKNCYAMSVEKMDWGTAQEVNKYPVITYLLCTIGTSHELNYIRQL